MKYAIRHLGSSDFLSGFDRSGDPEWVEGWDNSDMLLWPSRSQCTQHLHLVHVAGFHAMIEEIEQKATQGY